MEINSLEQLSINFANEKLQEHYLKVCIWDKQQRFIDEGLVVDKSYLWKYGFQTSSEISDILFSALNDVCL